MKAKGAMGGVSFHYLLLDNYKKFGISEKELAVLLMLNHLLDEGNELPTSDMLSLKMNLSAKEIDDIEADLYRRKFITFDTKKGCFTLEPLLNQLSTAFAKRMAYESEKQKSEAMEVRLSLLYDFIEDRWQRPLTPLERATVNEWVDASYSDKEIMDAVRDSLIAKKATVNYVGRRLRAIRASSDIESEGYSATNEKWDKPIDESLRIIREKWEDDDER